jgi:N-acetylgalactosamine kinase
MPFEISGLQPISSWIELIRDRHSTFHNKLNQIYGDNDDLKTEAARMCLRSLEAFTERYAAERNVIIIRSTGRINLVGTHIDHRGGSVNPIAVKHMWLVVEPRDDDLVLAKNVESNNFPDEQFCISRCLPAGKKNENWDTWCHEEFEKRRNDPPVSWSNYIRAAVLYL